MVKAHCVSQGDFELLTILLSVPKYWDGRCVLPQLVYGLFKHTLKC